MRIIAGLLVTFCFASLQLSSQDLRVVNLTTEYKPNPVGIDIAQPRFSWQIQSSLRDILQTEWSIRVAKNIKDLTDGKNLIWESKENTEQSIHIEYKGESLQSRQRYYWQVKIADNKGNVSTWSDPQYWEMGLLSPADWEAQWIQSTIQEDIYVVWPIPSTNKWQKYQRSAIYSRMDQLQ